MCSVTNVLLFCTFSPTMYHLLFFSSFYIPCKRNCLNIDIALHCSSATKCHQIWSTLNRAHEGSLRHHYYVYVYNMCMCICVYV